MARAPVKTTVTCAVVENLEQAGELRFPGALADRRDALLEQREILGDQVGFRRRAARAAGQSTVCSASGPSSAAELAPAQAEPGPRCVAALQQKVAVAAQGGEQRRPARSERRGEHARDERAHRPRRGEPQRSRVSRRVWRVSASSASRRFDRALDDGGTARRRRAGDDQVGECGRRLIALRRFENRRYAGASRGSRRARTAGADGPRRRAGSPRASPTEQHSLPPHQRPGQVGRTA